MSHVTPALVYRASRGLPQNIITFRCNVLHFESQLGLSDARPLVQPVDNRFSTSSRQLYGCTCSLRHDQLNIELFRWCDHKYLRKTLVCESIMVNTKWKDCPTLLSVLTVSVRISFSAFTLACHQRPVRVALWVRPVSGWVVHPWTPIYWHLYCYYIGVHGPSALIYVANQRFRGWCDNAGTNFSARNITTWGG